MICLKRSVRCVRDGQRTPKTTIMSGAAIMWGERPMPDLGWTMVMGGISACLSPDIDGVGGAGE